MTKAYEPLTKKIIIGGKELVFDQRVAVLIELDDRTIIRLKTDDFDYGDPLVGRNILCFDNEGKMLWRVEDHEMVIGKKDTPQSFLSLMIGENGEIETDIPDAYFNINPENGLLYDGVPKFR